MWWLIYPYKYLLSCLRKTEALRFTHLPQPREIEAVFCTWRCWTRYLEARKSSCCNWWANDRTVWQKGCLDWAVQHPSKLADIEHRCLVEPRKQHRRKPGHSRSQKHRRKGKRWSITNCELAQPRFLEEHSKKWSLESPHKKKWGIQEKDCLQWLSKGNKRERRDFKLYKPDKN